MSSMPHSPCCTLRMKLSLLRTRALPPACSGEGGDSRQRSAEEWRKNGGRSAEGDSGADGRTNCAEFANGAAVAEWRAAHLLELLDDVVEVHLGDERVRPLGVPEARARRGRWVAGCSRPPGCARPPDGACGAHLLSSLRRSSTSWPRPLNDTFGNALYTIAIPFASTSTSGVSPRHHPPLLCRPLLFGHRRCRLVAVGRRLGVVALLARDLAPRLALLVEVRRRPHVQRLRALAAFARILQPLLHQHAVVGRRRGAPRDRVGAAEQVLRVEVRAPRRHGAHGGGRRRQRLCARAPRPQFLL